MSSLKNFFKNVNVARYLKAALVVFAVVVGFRASTAHAAWGYYRAITVTSNTSLASGTQTNFPLLVNIPSSSYLQGIGTGGKIQNASGYDIKFSTSTACGDTLNFETEKYVASTGQLIDWVQVPSLMAGSVIYMCYGNSAITTDQSNAAGTWDSNYKGVWHMQETSGQHKDSTGNGNNTSAVAVTTQGSAAGQIGGADALTSTGDGILVPAGSSLNIGSGAATISAWVKFSSLTGGFQALNEYGTSADIGILLNGAEHFRFEENGASQLVGSTTVTTGNWYYVVITEAGVGVGSTYIYVNGVLDGTGGPIGNNIGNSVGSSGICGWTTQGTFLLNGTCEEQRISTGIARSPSWITTEYNNQNSPSTFYTVGSEGASAPLITPTTLPNAPLNAAYSQTFTVNGASGPYTWSLLSGTLPVGLTLDTTSTAATTTISGAPSVSGTSNFTVQVVSAGSVTSTQAYTLVVNPATVPNAPPSLSAIPGNAKVSLVWTAPTYNGGSPVTQYLLYDRLTGGGAFSQVGTAGASATSGVVSGLTNATGYDFEVSAVNAVGTSAASSISSATPTSTVTAAICYAVASGNWSSPSIWASSSGGVGGTCAANGGAGVTIQGQTGSIVPGVPGGVGTGDDAVINTGITVHIPLGIGVELSSSSSSLSADGLTINGTNSSTYGALIIDQGGVLKVHGNGTLNNYMTLNQYGVFQIMPGGSFWIGNAGGNPTLNVSGRFYSGCLDQSTYPSPFCAGNAGGWVTASTGSSLNITAVGSLPTGLAAGDLVELNMPQSPTSVGYPYTGIDGTTPPPAPPIMPITNDTGTSPMKTCGSVGSCFIPESTMLCVVSVSGSSVSLGWPRGGTTAQPYCTGAETAMNITNAGSGQLWLNKPAFFWGDPSQFTWNRSVSGNLNTELSGGRLDAIRSGIGLPLGPISNAAGTGPGRIGDNSVSLALTSPSLSSCSFLSVPSVTSSGCYINYDKGLLVSYGFNTQFSGAYSYTASSGEVDTPATVVIPTGTRQYNSLVLGNTDFHYLMTTGSNSFIQLTNLDNTANRQVAFSYNTVRMSHSLLGLGSNLDQTKTFVPTNVFQVIGNSWLASSPTLNSSGGDINFWSTTSKFDISQNYLNDYRPLITCGLNNTSTQFSVFGPGTITNNNSEDSNFFSGSNGAACQWTGNLLQDNRITGDGTADDQVPAAPGYQFAFNGLDNPTKSSPNLVKYNIVYGDFRDVRSMRGTTWDHNAFFNYVHHFIAFGTAGSTNGGISGQGETYTNNIIASYDGGGAQLVSGFNLGYAESQLLDGVTIANNTVLGGGFSCLTLGDLDSSSFTLLVGVTIRDNICAPSGSGGMFVKYGANAPIMSQMQLLYMGYNAIQGTNAPFLSLMGSSPNNANNIPNPEYNRDVLVTDTNGNYNTDMARHVTGVVIQNPLYSTNQTGSALRFTHTSNSNLTMQWALDGSTYGAAAQLNWGGSGTTYTLSATPTDPGPTYPYIPITVTGTPFAAVSTTGVALPTACPIARWALMTSGANAGTAYAIVNCTASNALSFAPHSTGLASGDTFVIIKPEVRLFDSGGTNYVDVGIDARSLPTTTQTDTGINLSMTDYCTGCAASPIISGLPTTNTPGTTGSPIVPFSFLPLTGGSAEQVFTSGLYVPSGTAWQTASSTGSYLGAVAPSMMTGTSYTFSEASSSGSVNSASGLFTVTPVGGNYTGTVSIALSGPGAAGLATPITETFSGSSSAQTFTITPTTAGTVTLTPTSSPQLGSDPAVLTYTANAVVPGAPTIGTATAGNTQATVTFTAPGSNGGATIDGYTVTSSPGGGTDSNAGSTGLSHVVTGLTNGTAYTFTVTAHNVNGNSAASSASNSVTPSTVPAAPTIGTATPGNAQATVTFTANGNGGSTITGYTVTSSPGGGTDSNAGSTGLSHVVTGLTNGTAYTFTVTAANTNGNSSASAASNSVTPSMVPGAPTIGTATGGNASATVTFTAPGSNGGATIDGYTVTSSPGGGTDSNAGTTGLSHVVTGLTNGTAYTFTVTAHNTAGNSSASSASNSVTPSTVPAAPTIGTATAGNASATVTFTANGNGGSTITGYTVASSPSGGTDSNAGSTGLSHVVTGLTNGTAYTFTVTAANTNGNSTPSSASNSVTPATVPGAPTIGTATAGNASATVTFTAPGSNGGAAIDGYTVASNPGGGTDSNAGSTSLSHVVTGLTNSTSYTFTVTAHNAKGNSSASAASNSVTPAAAATSYTFAEASGSGNVGSVSGSFTVTPVGGLYSGTISIALSGPGAAGLSTPITKTFVSSSSAQTFTITPTTAGTVTLTPTSSPQLGSDPAVLTYTANAVVPGAPTIGTATAGNTQATVTFTAPGSNGGATIDGYTVTSSPGGGTDSNAGSTGLSHVVTGLTNNTSYTFTVTAHNSAGNSSASSASNSVTPTATPPAISSLAVLPAQTAATVTWTTDLSTSSQVSYGTTSGTYTTTTSLADTSPTVTSHSVTFTGLTPGTLYYYVAISGSATSAEQTFTTVGTSSGGGGGGSSGGSGGGGGGGGGGPVTYSPSTPVTSIPVAPAGGPGLIVPAAPTQPSSSPSSLVNESGTYYVVSNGERFGVTDPGILKSYGYTFADATTATPAQLALPSGSNVSPAPGSLVRTASDPTVYVVGSGTRSGFVSAAVFQALGYRFSNVVVVTAPELAALSPAANVSSPSAAHGAGADVLARGTVYWIGPDALRHPYPSLQVYNSWHIDGDFSTVVPANAADLALPVGEAVAARVTN